MMQSGTRTGAELPVGWRRWQRTAGQLPPHGRRLPKGRRQQQLQQHPRSRCASHEFYHNLGLDAAVAEMHGLYNQPRWRAEAASCFSEDFTAEVRPVFDVDIKNQDSELSPARVQ